MLRRRLRLQLIESRVPANKELPDFPNRDPESMVGIDGPIVAIRR